MERSGLDWFIWGSLIISCILILTIAIIYYYNKKRKQLLLEKNYKNLYTVTKTRNFFFFKKSIAKTKIKYRILTLDKIPILSVLYGIFLIQAFITKVMPETADLIPFSLDTITIIAVGFLYGPIEAIIFGAVADISRTIINGWTPQLLPFFIFPITGLIAGIFGDLYQNRQKKSNLIFESLIFQATILLFCFITVLVGFLASDEIKEGLSKTLVFILTPLFLLLIEGIYIYTIFYDRGNFTLLLYITIVQILARIITGYIIRPYSMYFYYGFPLNAEIIKRVITSSYFVPANIFFSYWFVKISLDTRKKFT